MRRVAAMPTDDFYADFGPPGRVIDLPPEFRPEDIVILRRPDPAVERDLEIEIHPVVA